MIISLTSITIRIYFPIRSFIFNSLIWIKRNEINLNKRKEIVKLKKISEKFKSDLIHLIK